MRNENNILFSIENLSKQTNGHEPLEPNEKEIFLHYFNRCVCVNRCTCFYFWFVYISISFSLFFQSIIMLIEHEFFSSSN